jgi:hypothetical protein
VIYQKWLGCVQSAMPFGVLVLALFVPAVLTGFASVLSLVGWAAAVPIYVMAFAAYGLVFSIRAKTPARASFAMIVASVVLFYALSIPVSLLFRAVPGRGHSQAFLMAQVPPAAIGAILGGPMAHVSPAEVLQFTVGLVFSLALVTALGYGFFSLAVRQYAADDAKARSGK